MKKELNQYDVIVIGAGASGIIAAGSAASKGAKVMVVEKMHKPGRKLLITGRGRCNITHQADIPFFYENITNNPRFLKHAFNSFFVDDILKILHDQGVPTTLERGNHVFPVSNQAMDVLKALMSWVRRFDVEFIYDCKVKELIIEEGALRGVAAETPKGKVNFLASKVIICTGGKSYPETGSSGDGYMLAKQAGHSIVEPKPALLPLITRGDTAGKMQGLGLSSVKVVVWADGKKIAERLGDVMFAHYGFSGPAIYYLSRFVIEKLSEGCKVELSIDLIPEQDEKTLDKRLLQEIDNHGKMQFDNILKRFIPSGLAEVILELTKIDGEKICNKVSAQERKQVLKLIKDFRFEVSGHHGFKQAIITAGGVSTTEISSKTMESKILKNLFFAGEVIDIDANTGGFNLQLAYSTGWLAGQSASNDIL
ncbi:MAG: NAD(P)/FAD-dependent oxidoreductase [Bacteroidetes bacterium]|nr:NAD(P)/FAD-dependent oxidoreductase [Bacteroidota bacterium]